MSSLSPTLTRLAEHDHSVMRICRDERFRQLATRSCTCIYNVHVYNVHVYNVHVYTMYMYIHVYVYTMYIIIHGHVYTMYMYNTTIYNVHVYTMYNVLMMPGIGRNASCALGDFHFYI